MTEIFELESKIKQIIDELKGICSQNGLGNTADEERIITSIFLYKFLNDKFISNITEYAAELEMSIDEVMQNKNDEMDGFYDAYSQDVAFAWEDTIQYLINRVMDNQFYELFDNALIDISKNPHNDYFSIETAEGTKKPLFEPVTNVVESSARNNFAKAIFAIISQEKFDFSVAFEGKFDFYSAIFEYLIKDYNVASGTYAEYFTPQVISKIISKCLVGMSDAPAAAEIYDPAAGSGSLILHLAHELGQEDGINRAMVYTQDISNKSTRFLRINMLLNGMAESLGNIIQGDTMLRPAHYNVAHDPSSGIKHFSYITTNPPFKLNFSTTRNDIEARWEKTDRFFAGIPKTPKKTKDSMAIYLLFIQHVLYSLKEDGKAAVVVPTGFLTAQSGIEKKIRQKLVDQKILKGVISMPPQIFANTGTNVSVVFIDKANRDDKVILVDASKMGSKVKDGKNQRTVLSEEEAERIINVFTEKKEEDDFSVLVGFDDLAHKNCSFSAGQYFDVKIEYIELTPEEFHEKVDGFKNNLETYIDKDKKLSATIFELLERLSI